MRVEAAPAPTRRGRAGRLEAAAFIVAGVAAYGSAVFPWVTIRYGGGRIVASADHRSVGVVVGSLMVFLAIDVLARYPLQLRTHLLLAAASAATLGTFAVYDAATGHARTTRQFTDFVRAQLLSRLQHRPGSLDQTVQRLFGIWAAWFNTGLGLSLAFAAAAMGLAACLIGARAARTPLTAIASAR
jgi:hypothetical protein